MQLDWTHSKRYSLQREVTEGRMVGKRERGRPRQKLRDWMIEDGYGELREKAQHREVLSRWTFGTAGRQVTRRRIKMNNVKYY